MVTVDLDSLVGHPGAVGGEVGWAGPLDPEACRRLACDGAVTRVLVTRQHPGHHDHGPQELDSHLRTAMALLPPTLGGAPTQPLEVGRTTRVIQPAQRSALAVRDGGCVFPDCQRPLAWCEAHHVRHWLHGGPTDLANLALLCRTHHRAVHEGGWQLTRQPDGRLIATPPLSATSHRPATSQRRLNRPGRSGAPSRRLEQPAPTRPATGKARAPSRHRARRLHGARTADPPCQISTWRPSPTPEPSDGMGPNSDPCARRPHVVEGPRPTLPATCLASESPDPDPPRQASEWGPNEPRPPARRANGPDPPCHSTARGRTPEPRGNPVRTRRGDPRTGGA